MIFTVSNELKQSGISFPLKTRNDEWKCAWVAKLLKLIEMRLFFCMFVCMFQSQLQLQYHPRTLEPSLREKIVKKVGINFFSKINLLCENIMLVIVFSRF